MVNWFLTNGLGTAVHIFKKYVHILKNKPYPHYKQSWLEIDHRPKWEIYNYKDSKRREYFYRLEIGKSLLDGI